MSHGTDKPPVLLIEDDDDTRESMQFLLEMKGFHVRSARNGREGLNVLHEEGKACLILLDWMMPVMNGKEFLEEIRSDDRYHNIAVLVVTAYSGKDSSIPARHLKKPVPIDKLVNEVRAHCALP